MGGKSSTTQSSQTNQALQPFLGAYESLLSQAEGTAGQPLQQYGGQMIEGFTPQQLQAFGLVGNTTGATGDATASPYLQAAQQDFSNATQPLWSGVQQFSPSAINQYESPYTSDVVNATQNQFNLQNQQQQNQLSGNVASAGAFGGDRSAILASSLAGQQQTAQAPTIANLENTGYQTALGEFNQQQQAQLGANEANSWLNSQAAFGEGNLGQEAQNLQLTGANALQGAGAEQQALGQEQLNVPYEQFEQQQAYPFQTEQWLAGMETGLGGSAGSTSQGQSSTETPFNPLSALMGLTGIGGATGAFGSNGYLSNMFGSGGMDSEMQDMALAEMPFSKGGGIVLPFPHHRVRRHGGGIAGYADGSDIDPDDVPIPQPNPMRGAAATGTDGGWQAPYKIDLNETPVPTSVNPGWGADNPLWTSLIAGAGAGLAHNNFGDALQTAATDYSKGKQSMLESSQKAAEAQNEADYRKTSVEEEANGLSQRAYDAAQTLKQQGQHQTAEEQNWAAERGLEAKKIAQEGSLEAQRIAIEKANSDQGRYVWQPGTQPDPKTGQPVQGMWRLPTRGGEAPTFMANDDLLSKSGTAGGSSLSGREGVYFGRVAAAGNEAATAIKNITELPITTTRGLFGGREQGPSLLAATKEDLANAVTPQDAQSYNVIMAGVNRNLSTIEAAGLAPNGTLSHSMDALVIKDGDTQLTKLRKLAEYRQIVELGLEPNLSNPKLPPEQKQLVNSIIGQVRQAVPFTQHNITMMEQATDPQTTMADIARQDRLGSSPMGPPSQAIEHLKANPGLRNAFDQKYGQGAAAQVLGTQ